MPPRNPPFPPPPPPVSEDDMLLFVRVVAFVRVILLCVRICFEVSREERERFVSGVFRVLVKKETSFRFKGKKDFSLHF